MADAKKTKKEEIVEETTEVIEAPVAATTEEVTVEEPQKTTAKAGKRSAKAIAEVEEKQAKEERKAQKAEAEAEDKPKQTQKPARSLTERKGKGYRKSAEQIDKSKPYSLKEALDLATKTSHVKFDATVEVHINLGVDPRHADQNLRDTIVLPAGTGKNVRVAVFADTDDVAAAKKAGADIAAGDEFLQQLDKGTLDFDVLIATPAMMPKLGKYARTLGPKGLMPNPKSGTVTTDVTKAVTEAKAGRVEYRVDSTGIVHVGVGKVSFGADKLNQNTRALFASIKNNKPASIKGTYVKAVHVTTSMGPSIKVENSEI
jgi:ribosomal protein L1